VITAVERSDFPVIKAVAVSLAVLTMLINLLVDLMYRAVDPRVSSSEAGAGGAAQPALPGPALLALCLAPPADRVVATSSRLICC
jgi:hypothetical protein